MIFDASKIRNVYIACGYTDMRKQIDGLAAIVELQYKMHFDTESIFLFCGRKADRIKQWPRSEKELLQITPQQFRWLMEGLSITQKKVIRNTEPARMF